MRLFRTSLSPKNWINAREQITIELFLIGFQHFTVLVYHVFPENGSLSYLSEWDSYIKFTIREYMEGTFFMKSAVYVHCNTTTQYPYSLGGP